MGSQSSTSGLLRGGHVPGGGKGCLAEAVDGQTLRGSGVTWGCPGSTCCLEQQGDRPGGSKWLWPGSWRGEGGGGRGEQKE